MSKKLDEKKKKTQQDLKKLLADPQYRGRVVKPAELYRKLNVSRSTFYNHIDKITLAQSWLTENRDAPVDAKRHYQSMLDEEIKGLENEVLVTTDQRTKNPQKFYVSKNQARLKAIAAGKLIQVTPPRGQSDGQNNRITMPSGGVTVREKSNAAEIVEVSEADKLIDQIREHFVFADLGEMPNVTKIMKDFGLIDSQGNETNPEVTERIVRERMLVEGWKEEREGSLHRAFDVIPNEVKMITMMRNLDTQKLLYNEIKLIHRMNAQYYRSGQVKTIDGNKILEYSPDHGTIAGMAEVMRRMVDGGTNINILINQFEGQEKASTGSLSLTSRNYLNKLTNMSPEEVEEEARRLEDLAKMLADDAEGKVTIDEIESQERQIIDVEPSKN